MYFDVSFSDLTLMPRETERNHDGAGTLSTLWHEILLSLAPQLESHARLANCDVALSFEDSFSILERLLPKDILLAAANAASSRGAGRDASASASAAASAASVAAGSGQDKAPGSLETLRAKADAALWNILYQAEVRGSTFDVRVELADWGLAWEPWRSKGGAFRCAIR